MSQKALFRLSLLALTAISVVLFMGKPYEQTLQAMDSSLHARLALNATSNGLRPVVPMMPGFNDHPFTLFYINGWIMRFFGPDAWSARLLPSAFAVGSVLLVAWLGALIYSPTVGLAAGLILATSREFISYGARFQLDPAMVFFILLSFLAWWKKKPLWTGVAAGLGMWMKNPLALLVFPSTLVFLVLTGSLDRREVRKLVLSGLIAIGIGSLVWIFSGYLGGWEVVSDYWKRQVFGTAVGGRGYSQDYDPFMACSLLRKAYWPWFPLFLISLYFILKNRRWKQPEVALPLSASAVVIVVISAMRFKFSHYFLPMWPFVALLTVDGFRNWIERNRERLELFLIGSAMILPAVLVAMPIELAPEMFPAFKRFSAIIQSYGTCQDKILYIEGEQPYGSHDDYSEENAFYTNRKMITSSCADAEAITEKEKPSWILVSGSRLQGCLKADVRAHYPVQYKFGNQYLLSNLIDSKNALDLTPLARELKAPADCGAAPLPKNRYYRYE